MHIFKQLVCTAFMISSATLCCGNESPLKQPSSESYEFLEKFKALHAQQENLHNQLNKTIKKACKKGWPLSARLVTLGLASCIVWDHKNAVSENIHAVRSKAETARNLIAQAIISRLNTTKETLQRIKEAVKQPQDVSHETTDTQKPIDEQEAPQKED